VIGYPFLLEKAKKRKKSKHRSTLVISDGLLPQLNIEVCSHLLNGFDASHEVILKLHPGEVPMLKDRYRCLMGKPGLTLKTHESVYDLLASAHNVVGFASTVMIEALAFQIRPFVLQNDFSRVLFEDIEFNYFESPEELVNKIKHVENLQPNDFTRFWADDFAKNFAEVVKGASGIQISLKRDRERPAS
jgi:hypothetical protein